MYKRQQYYLASSYKLLDKIDVTEVVRMIFVGHSFTRDGIRYTIEDVAFDMIQNRFTASTVYEDEAEKVYTDIVLDRRIFSSIFDALAMAGDLTIYGIRTDVAVAREVDGVRTIEYLDLTSKELFNSPAFYIQQNDVIYVKPNKYKAQAGEISQNRNFYLSLVGTAISVATLIITLTK